MIAHIYYESENPVDDRARAEIYAEAERLAAESEWWFDPLALQPVPEFPRHLIGYSKLLRAAPIETVGIPLPGNAIPDRDNALMGFIDLQRIVALLQQLGRSHGIVWALHEDRGEPPIGRINHGAVSPELQRFLTDLRDEWEFTPEELEDTDRRNALLVTYVSSSNITLVPSNEALPPEREVSEES